MNDRQNTIVATAAAALILGTIFLCPWRVEPTGELQWSPIYQPPLTYVRTFDAADGTRGGARIESEDAQIAFDILALQGLAIALVAGSLYALSANADREYDPPPPPASR